LPAPVGLRTDKRSGASRARTDDLVAASDALSQLSYSPECASRASLPEVLSALAWLERLRTESSNR
jgi:hypothetical protein